MVRTVAPSFHLVNLVVIKVTKLMELPAGVASPRKAPGIKPHILRGGCYGGSASQEGP